MVAGLGVTTYYMIHNEPWLRGIAHVNSPIDLWFGIQPIAAGAFGVPVGLAVMVAVSLLTPAPSDQERAFVKNLRIPRPV